jgi:hypothetical protein
MLAMIVLGPSGFSFELSIPFENQVVSGADQTIAYIYTYYI